MKIKQTILNGILIIFLGASIPCTAVQATELPGEEMSAAATSASSGEELSEEDAASMASSEEVPEKELSREERLEQIKSSVVQINCVYIGDDDKHHIIKGAPGTLIGKKDGTEYVITGLSSITPNKDLKNSALKALGVDKEDWDKTEFKYEVVVQNDIVFSAELLSSSEELNLGVFTLSQVLSQRTPMTLLYSESGRGFTDVEDVHAYGFPDSIVFGKNEVYYPNERVNRISGKVSNIVTEGNVEWIEHNATIAGSNSGGPLVSDDGEMVGLNILKTEGTYFYSISSNSIVKVLDGLGIEYDKISVEEKERNKESAAATVSSSTYVDPQVVPQPTIPTWLIVIVIILVVLVLAILIAVVGLMTKKSDKPSFKERREQKKEEKNRQITPEQFDNRRTSKKPETGVMNKNLDGTNVLAPSIGGETSVLTPGSSSVAQGIYGSMYRKQYSENIIINKMHFVIGKDSAHVDYCIRLWFG